MPPMKATLPAVLALFIVCACGATEEQLRARAAFDMSCPNEQLTLVQIDDRTQGVTGCGQKATYVESCGMRDGYGGKHDCTWVLNTDSKRVSP
jgi:hypothetical protein